MPRDNPSKIAKILSNIAYYEAGEYGLYWDEDGTMPWKELYWVLQRQDDLCHLKQSYIKQLELLGEDLPFILDNNRLVLKADIPTYEPSEPPTRLFHAISISSLEWTKKKGLHVPQNRSYLPLWIDVETSLQYTKPSHVEKIVITVDAKAASERGIIFYKAGPKLYLVKVSIPSNVLHFPFVKQRIIDDLNEKKNANKKKIKTRSEKEKEFSPGSFTVALEHFGKMYANSSEHQQGTKTKSSKKRSKGPDWKRQARKIRKTKRSI